MSVSQICEAVRAGTIEPREANTELSARRKAPKQKITTNAKVNVTDVCADVRAGKITAAEGNRLISESRRK